MSADLYFTRDSSFFLSFFYRPLIYELPEQNYTISGHMVGSKCNLKMHVQNLGYPFLYKSGAQKRPFFGQLRSLMATLTAYIFWTEHDIDNQSSMLTTKRGLEHRPKTSWTLVHKQLKTRPAILPTLCKFRIPLHCQASQPEISKWNSAKLCQTMDARLR